MVIRKAICSDIPRLMEIYREARLIQLDSGNLHQWREGYPSEELVRDDITRGVCYAVVDGDLIVGAFAFIPGKDSTYSYIEGGQWIEDTSHYATIHRLASLKTAHGVAQTCFDWCWNQIQNLRIDTHEDNSIMRHCVEKAGFQYCGVIYLSNGDPRMAFQKIQI